MPDVSDQNLLEPLMSAWERNSEIVLKLLHVIPEGGLEARAMEGSPSVAELFTHISYVRLVFVHENAPEFGTGEPAEEWVSERNRDRIAQTLTESAAVVRRAVEGRLKAGRELDRHFGHPVNMLQLLVWHEGYHHGQIKLALKLAGKPLSDEEAGPASWGVWMRKD